MRRLALALPFIFFQLSSSPVMAQDVTIPFDLSQQGVRFQPTWGLDQAWISDQNMRKGINHMGKENVGIGRSCFRTVKALINDSVLDNDAINYMRRRANIFNQVGDTLPLVLTVDQEAGSDEYFVKNKNCDVNHWAANIVSHVHWMQQNSRHPVIGVSIYNEPDYWSVEEGATNAKQIQIAKLLRQQPRLDSVAIVGANTLNDDQALNWYTSGKEWYEWGNTHQLAGDFAHFANFYQQLVKDGKVGYGDEMHNVGEAMIGLEYGMTIGIWWGFDSRARGEFCDISRHGERLAYGEHRANWTAASVWRHDDGRVKAFIGSSERQAATTTYQFLSLDRDVYFDGHGPLRNYTIEIPGGTGYQKGQTNAERVIDITWGDNVAPSAITSGLYKLINKKTGGAVAYTANGSNIVQQKYTGTAKQQWTVKPCDPRTGGDYSFYDIEASDNAKIHLNVKNYSTSTADIIAWTQDKPTSNEQWYLQYAGDGYYYLRNRESALYMSSAGTAVTSRVQQTNMLNEANRDRMLWRLLPVDVDYETEAPAQPTSLLAEPQSASVRLTWEMGKEDDLDGYIVLRADQATGEWNTIARHVNPPFIDKGALPGHTYLYKIKAIDRAQNISETSAETTVTTPTEKALVAHWIMNETLEDATDNQMNGSPAVIPVVYEDGHAEGTKSLRFKNKQYIQLPTDLIKGDQLTVSMWIRPMASAAWQRLFDFGHDSSHYIYLTTSTGTTSRLAMKAGTNEQTIDFQRFTVGKWHHVVVTLAPGTAAVYVNGKAVAQREEIPFGISDIVPIINYFGRSQASSSTFFQGNLEDVRLYNYALTADEVSQLYDTVSAIETTQQDSPSATIHSLDGMRLQQPRHGLNIINGKVQLNR